MIHGETYLLCNMGLCACAYPLGGRLAGLPLPRPSRWMLAAVLGGAGAICALFLPSPLWLLLLPAGVVLCFGHFGWQACLRCLVTTLCAALLCGGTLSVLLRSASPGAAWAATAALCLLLYWLAALSPSSMTAVRQVELTVGEHSVLLPAMVDTGNLLRDPITGLPVLVVPFRAVRVLLPEIARWVQHQELPPRMRLISVRTAAGSSLLPVFRPDRLPPVPERAQLRRGRGCGGHRAGVRRYSGAGAVGRAARKSAGQSGRIAPPGAYKEEKPMDQHSLTLQLRFQRLLAKLFPQELYYIGGPDPLPPPLSPEEEREMTRRLKNHDEAARATLIEHNLRLVVFISRRFENTGIPLEDLISIGTIGLIKAVGTFDCDKKIKMATYASRCIENEILMFLRKSSRLRLEVSLDEPLKTDWDGNELLLSDVLGTRPDTVSVNLDKEIERDILRDALERLNPREKRIIMLRFGLGGQRERTQKEVADLLGISQSYISRLEKRILSRLNTELKRIG